MSAKSLDALLGEALRLVEDPAKGLPDPLFGFALRIVPMINVDLLVRNAAGEHLLAWREDEYDAGWHVPGGIIRFNEPIAKRIDEVARTELGCDVISENFPSDIFEFFTPRGHFISLMYLCKVANGTAPASRLARERTTPKHGELAWTKGVPDRLYRVHRVYRGWLDGSREKR